MTHIDSCEASREGRFAPRWTIDKNQQPVKLEFCQQVGLYDLWLTPYAVIVVTQPKRGETLGVVTLYTYEHAGQRFPLVEHKIMAMRAMIFGAN